MTYYPLVSQFSFISVEVNPMITIPKLPMCTRGKKLLWVLSLTLVLLMVQGCTLPFNQQYRLTSQALRVEEQIERHFSYLKMLDVEERSFQRFAIDYMNIEVEIQTLKRMQERFHSEQPSDYSIQKLESQWEVDQQQHIQLGVLSDDIVAKNDRLYQVLLDELFLEVPVVYEGGDR